MEVRTYYQTSIWPVLRDNYNVLLKESRWTIGRHLLASGLIIGLANW